MAVGPITLIANPGSASRKYAVFSSDKKLASVHFEFDHHQVICTLESEEKSHSIPLKVASLDSASAHLMKILGDANILTARDSIDRIGLRVVAPGEYFLSHRLLDDEAQKQLESLRPQAPLHIAATLKELTFLKDHFSAVPIYGLSDSAFHITKPDFAWNYGISLDDADKFDIKRFGYHGLSAEAAVETMRAGHKLAPKTIVCHLGSGVSVTAVEHGRSFDTTMGYSPLEGPIMSTRSGSVDFTALRALQNARGFTPKELEMYLNQKCGLLGLGGSADMRELLEQASNGEHLAGLAINTFAYSIVKAIGQMSAALGGADLLLFTGTIGERSAPIRKRVVSNLHFLDFILDDQANQSCTTPEHPTCISRLAHSRPIYAVPTDEAGEMLRQIKKIA